MRDTIIFLLIIGIPSGGCSVAAYHWGYKRGANMVLDKLKPLFQRTAYRLGDYIRREGQ